jgi:hypothetical protein
VDSAALRDLIADALQGVGHCGAELMAGDDKNAAFLQLTGARHLPPATALMHVDARRTFPISRSLTTLG